MTLNQLICRAASVYPDGLVLEYWDMNRQEPRPNQLAGDPLAAFIAGELADSYDPAASEAQQIATAVRVMQTAAADLQAVAQALSELARERRQAA